MATTDEIIDKIEREDIEDHVFVVLKVKVHKDKVGKFLDLVAEESDDLLTWEQFENPEDAMMS